jgi:hypothetical protein
MTKKKQAPIGSGVQSTTADMNATRKSHVANSSEKQAYRDAEKIINKSPELKKIRSMKDGEKSLFHSGFTGGKGSAPRPGSYSQEYKDNFDAIKWNKEKEKPKFKVRINGVLQYPEDDNEV